MAFVFAYECIAANFPSLIPILHITLDHCCHLNTKNDFMVNKNNLRVLLRRERNSLCYILSMIVDEKQYSKQIENKDYLSKKRIMSDGCNPKMVEIKMQTYR